MGNYALQGVLSRTKAFQSLFFLNSQGFCVCPVEPRRVECIVLAKNLILDMLKLT